MLSARPVVIPLTYEDYAALPEDGQRWELIDGELEKLNAAPSTRHQTISRRLQYELMQQLEIPKLGYVFNAPTDVILSLHNVVQPDLILINAARREVITKRAIEGVPDVVVEIISPSSSVMDRRVKKELYARFLVPEYWLIDPTSSQIELYRLGPEGYRLEQRFDRDSRLKTPSFQEVDVALEWVFRE